MDIFTLFALQDLLLSGVFSLEAAFSHGLPSWEVASIKFLSAFLSSSFASSIFLKIFLLNDLFPVAFDPSLPSLFLTITFLSEKQTFFLSVFLNPDLLWEV